MGDELLLDRAAHQRIVAALAQANAADPSAHHLYDSGSSLGWQLVAADVAITDISAMVYDRLATGKPLIVARPASAAAEIDESGYLSACEWLSAEQADQIVPLVDHVLTSPEAHDALTAWVTRYFGDTTPGAATARFHAAVETLIDEWERAAAAHAADPITSESDPLDDEEDEDAVPGED